MIFGVQVVIGWMAFVALFGFVLLGWGLETGQFDEMEEIRFIPLEEKEPVAWAGRDAHAKGK